MNNVLYCVEEIGIVTCKVGVAIKKVLIYVSNS